MAQVEIVSPERLVLSQQVTSVVVPGIEGYFTYLPEHAPLMTTLRPGFLTVTDINNVAHMFYVSGGFADVTPSTLSILAEEARPVGEFDRAAVEGMIASGMSALQAASTAQDQMRIQSEIDDWRNLLLEANQTAEAAH
jgi:F-type H+-transporting ATPase subunit epsilon